MKNLTNLSIVIDPQLDTHVIHRAEDVDYLIDIDYYTLNLSFPSSFMSRIQFPSMRTLLLRTSPSSSMVTLHILKDTDLYSSISNFELNLTHHQLLILQDEGCITITIKEVLNS